jgi:cyanophycinase
MIGNGCVIAIGGNEDKRGLPATILASFVERAGGADARIVIIPSASEVPELKAARYSRIFRRLGAADVLAVHAERGEVSHEEREAIRGASGIFVTGGDQGKLMEHLAATGCIEPIREAVRGGAVYAGTSAGAAAVSRTMIAHGEGELVTLGEGLGFLPDIIIDQHFSERRRLPRLMIAAKSRSMVGIGIDEDTAVVFRGGDGRGELAVEGVGNVTIVDRKHRLHVLKAAASASA